MIYTSMVKIDENFSIESLVDLRSIASWFSGLYFTLVYTSMVQLTQLTKLSKTSVNQYFIAQ